MKKLFTLLFITLLFLFSCTKEEPPKTPPISIDNTEITKPEPEVTKPPEKTDADKTTEKTLLKDSDVLTRQIGESFFINRHALEKSDKLSSDEAVKIFKELLDKALFVENHLLKVSPPISDDKIVYNDYTYYYIDLEEYKTFEDIRNAVFEVFTNSCAMTRFSSLIYEDSSRQKYIERGGKLYCNTSSGKNDISYDYDTIKLTEQYKGVLVFSVDTYISGDFEETRTFVIIETENGWRLPHSTFDEKEAAPDFQFEKIDLARLDEAETFKYASHDIDGLPKTFEHNGESVKINYPKFTGFKTNNVKTYKEFFAFENNSLVLTALEEEALKERYFLIDRTGKIIDIDYPSHTVVTDREKISCYPEGIEVVQTGEPGAYKQQLYKDGVAISDVFDEIGFFNNGIALARVGNKYGFISIEGETLVEPFIEADDLRYSPDYNRGYQVLHLTDDAFVLPINGELAIITLTRTKKLDIPFPEEFEVEEYVEPTLCEAHEFVWGEYVPFVNFAEARYTNGGSLIFGYAFLTPETDTLEEGKEIYKQFNDKYKTASNIIDGTFLNVDIKSNKGMLYKEFLFESKITKVSEDLKHLERLSFRCIETAGANNLLSSKWQSKLEIIDNGEVVNTYKSKNTAVIYQLYTPYGVYENKTIYEIPSDESSYVEIVDQVGNVLLVSRGRGEKQKLYMYNLETGALTHLLDYAFDAKISPDLKYLVYTNFNWELTLEEQKNGFYIKNLEDGKTVFYPCKSVANYVWSTNHACQSFVLYDSLKELGLNTREG